METRTWVQIASGRCEEIEKKDILTLLHWGKQLIALALGIFLGFHQLQGFLSFVIFGTATIMGSYSYVMNFLKAQDKVEVTELYQEGMMASFALFVVSWVVTFTAQQKNTIFY